MLSTTTNRPTKSIESTLFVSSSGNTGGKKNRAVGGRCEVVIEVPVKVKIAVIALLTETAQLLLPTATTALLLPTEEQKK